MEKRTIAQAAIEVLKETKQPMTVAEITQAILDKELYNFNTKNPRAMVREAIEKRCQGVDRKKSVAQKYFIKLQNDCYQLIN